MRLNERLLVVLVVLCSASCDNKRDTKRGGRHFLALLGYLHGYKVGQEYALQYPSYLITPIVIAPSVSQQQSVNIQKGSTDENYQESGGVVQIITHDKIVSSVNETSKEKQETSVNITNNNIEVQKRSTSKPIFSNSVLNEDNSENVTASLRQSLSNVNNTDKLNNTGILETTSSNMTTVPNNMTSSDKNSSNMTTEGSYPSAAYNNEFITSINLTTSIPIIGNDEALPPIIDSRWQNFTMKANLSSIMSDDNTTMTNEQQNNTAAPSFSKENKTEYSIETTTNKGPYTKAWYYNPTIDQLSITKNYYTNKSPLAQSDGWGSNSLEKEISLPQLSGFRPLAGLYYDGFLHRPLKKFGFLPQNYWS